MSKKIKKGKQAVKKVVKNKKCVCPVKVSKPFNKSKITGAIADMTCLSKKDANLMLDTLFEIIASHLKRRSGVGEFTLPGIAKFKVVNKPATKACQGINPFTGESMMFAAKPARNIIKVRALKKIKDIAK
ncbi:MAG: HU family DNA-binding protein [Coxiellaceae bacterium]|nr:HU family DNA-binding protein [Coxiellaceae bacterium]